MSDVLATTSTGAARTTSSTGRAATTHEIGVLYRRRTIADAIAALEERDRDLVRRRQLDGTDVVTLTRNLRLDPDRAARDLTAAHRHLVAACPWLAGETRCTDTRAALLAGTDHPDDIEHLRGCPGCRAADLLGLQTELADPDAWNGSWQAVGVRWDHEPDAVAGVGAGHDVPAWRRRILAVLAVAGALVLVVATTIVVRGRGDEAVVASAALTGGDLAPGATGAVEIFEDDAGFRIELRAPDLPEPADGSFYQAWIKRGDGLVAIGTFSRGGDVVLWSGVPLADGDLVTVTLEPDDGDPSSSGQRVLAGPVTLAP